MFGWFRCVCIEMDVNYLVLLTIHVVGLVILPQDGAGIAMTPANFYQHMLIETVDAQMHIGKKTRIQGKRTGFNIANHYQPHKRKQAVVNW